jgi:hypothetical protein
MFAVNRTKFLSIKEINLECMPCYAYWLENVCHVMRIGLQAGFVKVDLNVDKSTLYEYFKHYDRSQQM